MKQQIYQNGFWFLLGLILGGLMLYIVLPNENRTENTIRIEMTKDSVRKVTRLASLNERNLKMELDRHNIPHADIVLAQAKLETGNFKSSLVGTHQNIFGLRKGNRYRRYSHWTECVRAYSNLISSRYKGGDYYAFLERIGYADDPEYIQKLRQIA